MMKRVNNWERLLAEFIKARQHVPFERGVHDCCLFAADWVQLATGIDFAGQFRGRYHDDESALLIIESAGGLVELVAGLLGEPCPIAQAGRGDIVAVSYGATGAIGICCGQYSVFVGHDRMYRLPTSKCEAAWRI
jgi:hypothetical protein